MSHVLGEKEVFRIGKAVCGFWHGKVEYSRQTLIIEGKFKFSPPWMPCTLFSVIVGTARLYPMYLHAKSDWIAILTPRANFSIHRSTTTSIMCHSSHVMRHSAYRHFNPPKHTADGYRVTSSAGFYLHALLLFCWFLASMHWAWVWYTKRQDVQEEEFEKRYCLPLYERQLRDGRWEDCEHQVGLLSWPDDISISTSNFSPGICHFCADWLTGVNLV